MSAGGHVDRMPGSPANRREAGASVAGEPEPSARTHAEGAAGTAVLVLGIGNILMGDEGVGVHVVRHLQSRPLPRGSACLDGGTGGFHLLGALQQARHVILVDATVDGQPVGTVRRLRPRFSRDYPRTLTAHDIGLKDLLDAFYLLGKSPEVTLFAVSIAPLQDMRLELSAELEARVGEIAEQVRAEATSLLDAEAG